MRISRILTLFLALALFPAVSWASLGGSDATIDADAAKLNATIAIKQDSNYTQYNLSLPSKVQVREYVANKKVFAVVWEGPHNPNIHQVLGSYFSRLQGTPTFADHASAKFIQPDFVASVRGSINNHHGKAYLPENLPFGVNSKEIQ